MKTLGGYTIEKFKRLKKPIERQKGILLPLIYQGMIFDPLLKKDVEIQWNALGKCSNYQRQDCFIDLNKINQEELKEYKNIVKLFRKYRKMSWDWEWVEMEGAINMDNFIKAIKEYDKSKRNRNSTK